MEQFKKEKMRSKCRYTRTKNKLMMVMEGGMSSRMHVMESLDAFTNTYEDVLQACENLGKCYEDLKDSGRASALSNELGTIEEDFTEIEELVKGYLSSSGNSSVKERTEQLREEVCRREVELSRIEQEIERTYAECQRQLGQKLRSEKPSEQPEQETRETEPRGRDQESKKKSEELNGSLSSKEPIKE
ncbi:hypothetical protein ACROYT_G011356, partial [Oculina patagonica]